MLFLPLALLLTSIPAILSYTSASTQNPSTESFHTSTSIPYTSTSSTSTSSASSTSTTSTYISNTSTSPIGTSSTSSTSTSSSNSPTSTSKSIKRGLAFSAGGTPGDLNNANQTNSLITWQYDWGNSPATYITDSHIEYIPMQWGSANANNFAATVKSQGATIILGFNEPDSSGQANMKASDAASIWQQSIQPLKASGVRLGGPAVSAPGTGIPWLIAFFAACSNCTIDFLPIHWYGDGLEGFYQYLWAIHGEYPTIPIWVTEFASTSTNESVVLDFLNQSTTYLDTLDWVERYAWFGYFRPNNNALTNLLDADGGLSALGQLYVGAKTVHTQVVTQAPTPTFTTINGGYNPTQGIVTTYAASPNHAIHRWVILRRETLCLGAALAGAVVGAIWL